MTNAIATMNLAELKALEDAIKARKATLKETAKADKEALNAETVSRVNEMINNGTLKLDMDVIVLYGSKNEEVRGKIVGVLNTSKTSLTIESTAFKSTKEGEENVPKRRYVDKSRFVRVAD